ncbi:MAG: hypothetical protein VKI39_07640 [Synechococcus sp.]|nr:hypothetical protein [Synechococcus sp.]
MQTAINSRAKLPTDLKAIKQQFKTEYKTLLSTNPKTEKSKVQTYILHLAPSDISGVNVCAGAGNCRKICLHFAGNPVYMTNKQAARIRRTLAYVADPSRFARLIVCAILDKINKHPGESLAFRLNGTSDIAWENVDFTITPAFATFCRVKFGAILPIGKRNIFELFNFMRSNTGENVTFYDYTKIKRNWAECKRLGYHLTFSFDGWNNAANIKLCRDALNNGVNVAAAFNLKRGQDLPQYVNAARLFGNNPTFSGRVLCVQDGDLTDYRPNDTPGGSIIGLRFKLPHGLSYTDADKMAFCIQ